MGNIFDKKVTQGLIDRVNQLTPATQGRWGKMHVAQMMAHCNVAYEMTYDSKHPKPSALSRFIIKLLAKKQVVGPKPYPKNGRTAPAFIVSEERDFEEEKKRLIDYLEKTQTLGADYFDGRESHSFGKLTTQEWSTMFYKHLDHHLTQFGV